MTDLTDRALRYDRDHARSLRALAYCMLGSRAEAEDIVQEAWLRWAKVDESTVQNAGAYLSRLVTNLCLDKLGSATAKRGQYIGVRLPEPLLDDEGGWSPGPEVQAEFAQDVSVAFLLALERLSPLERAAFLLHEVFDLDFDEIGRHLERSAAACRKLASRARDHVKATSPGQGGSVVPLEGRQRCRQRRPGLRTCGARPPRGLGSIHRGAVPRVSRAGIGAGAPL